MTRRIGDATEVAGMKSIIAHLQQDYEFAVLRAAAMEAELRHLVKYARWQMTEGANFHPTLPSAVSSAESVLGSQSINSNTLNFCDAKD
jgi:hypothetical protein